MRKFFQYNNYGDADFTTLVEGSLELARQAFEGKKAEDYSEKNRTLLQAMGKKMVANTGFEAHYESQGLELFKSPMINGDPSVRRNFNIVLSEVIKAYIPEVVNAQFETYLAEVKQIGYGDTAKFKIESNDLFKVNSLATGIRKGVDQHMFDDEVTVNPAPLEISTSIDWYTFAAGIFDMGNFALKIARSYEAYIFRMIVVNMLQAETAWGSAYTANGVDITSFGTLRDRVSAANGGMSVVAIGTRVALAACSLQGNYAVEIGEQMNKVGYLDQYLGVPLIGLENPMLPKVVNGAATLALPNNKIYLIPVGGTKPVKVVFEGNDVSVSFNPEETSDSRYGLTVKIFVGIAAVCGSKYGTINLA